MSTEVAGQQEEEISCEDCGRKLRTAKARAERVGPVCRRRRLAAMGAAA